MKGPVHLSHCLSSEKGFTLIELLVAMTVSAVIAVLSYQAIASMVQVEEGVTDHQKQMQKLQRAFWWLEQDLIQMTPRMVNDGMGGVLSALNYREDTGLELSRLANFMTPHSQNGVLRVGYQLEQKTFYRLLWPVMDRVADTEPKKIPVLEDVESWKVRLLDQSNNWQLNWPAIQLQGSADSGDEQSGSTLPKLIEISLTFADGQKVKRLFRGTDSVLPMFQQQLSDDSSEGNDSGATQ